MLSVHIPLYKGYFDSRGILKGTFYVLHSSGDFSNQSALFRKAVLRVTICCFLCCVFLSSSLLLLLLLLLLLCVCVCVCFWLRWYWFTDVMKEGKLCEQIRQLKACLINAVLLV